MMKKARLIKISSAIVVLTLIALACSFTYDTNISSPLKTVVPTLDEVQINLDYKTPQPVLELKQPTRVVRF
jgi:hypothetical protein